MDALKVFIADHFFIVRQGIKAQLAPANMEIVGEAADKRQLYARLLRRHRQVDVLVLEVGIPDLVPGNLIPALRLKYPTLKILVLTETCNPWGNTELLQCGVQGIMLKSDNTDLAPVVHKVARGESYYSPGVWFWRTR